VQNLDAIPDFKPGPATDAEVGVAGVSSALAGGSGSKSVREILAIILVAIVIIAGTQMLLITFKVPQFIFPLPTEIGRALITDFPLIAPHLGYTLVELFSGFAIGSAVGLVLAAVVTQFPFVEKVVTPYILVLVTTPMLALVPLLILRFGFGYTPRIIAVALASGPMVMINAATGFRRVDRGKLALAHSYGASTGPYGSSNDLCWPDGRFDFRPADRRGRGDGRRWLRLGQSPDVLFVDDPDAAVLRRDLDPLDSGHPHLRALLSSGEALRQLGSVTRNQSEVQAVEA
jgi:Binding-protein-dependent transport system inner membrane component